MFYHYLDPVEKEVFKASAEVLLVSQEDLVEVAHPSDEHPVVDVQLVEPARKFRSAVTILSFFLFKKRSRVFCFEAEFSQQFGTFEREIMLC